MNKNDLDFIKSVGRLTQTDDIRNRQLVINIRQGDKNAMTELISGLMKFICKLAKQQIHSYDGDLYSIHDLIAAGCLGVEKAVNGFKPEVTIKFSSYAYWWIIKAMYEEKKTWGMSCVSLDDPITGIDFSGGNPYDYADCNTLKDILNEDEINERIALLRLKAKKKPKEDKIDD